MGSLTEEHLSNVHSNPSNVSFFPFKSVTTKNCSQIETLMRTTGMQMSFPETLSDSFCKKFFGYTNRLL